MIVFMWALVATPTLLFVVSPNSWRYASALENQKSGQLELAKEQFKEITESDPRNVAAWFRLSEIALERKDLQESERCIDQALRFRILEFSLERNDYRQSLQCLNGAIRTVDLPTRDKQTNGIVDQKITTLLASGKGEQAVALIKQQVSGLINRFARSGKKGTVFSDLSQSHVNELLAASVFQNYFNKLAYLSAVANIELKQASQFIDAVPVAFHQRHKESRLLLPYLHELNGNYEKAQDAYADILVETASELPPLDGLSSFLKKQFGIEKQEVKSQVNVGQVADRYKVLHRMKMIAERLAQKQCVAQIDELLQRLPEQEKQDSSLELMVEREKILEQASSLCSYLDTRAFIRYRQAIKLETEMARGITEIDFLSFNKAKYPIIKSLHAKSLAAIDIAMELHDAIERFNEIQPLNSLVVRRSTDEIVAARRDKKNSAVMNFHYALILESNGRFNEATSARKKVGELGFEMDELLF